MVQSHRILSPSNRFDQSSFSHISLLLLLLLEYFKAVQITLTEPSLISILQAQIVQCEKSIHLCQLKDRAEQVKSEELLE